MSDSFEDLDPRIREAVEGLLYLGAISDEFEFCGHSFGLRTLRAGEEIAAGKAIESYRDTLKEADAWSVAQVGLALVHVDGDENFCPQAGPDPVAFAKARYNYLSKNWYMPTIDFLFHAYGSLVQKQIEALEAIRNLSAGSQPMSWPSEDSFEIPGTLNDEISLEIQPLPL